MKKRNLGLFIRLGLSVILLVVLFIIIDWQELLTALAKIQISEYLIGLLLYLGVMAFWSLRWYLLIRATDNPLPVSLRRVFRTILISVFYSNFLPTVVGTDMGRLYELSPDHKPTAAVASTVLLDRLIGLASLVLMAVVALLVGYHYANKQGIILTIGFLVVALVVCWVLFFNENFIRRFRWLLTLPVINRGEQSLVRLYQALAFLQRQPKLIGLAVIVSLFMQSLEVFAVAFIARSLGMQIDLFYFFVFLPIIWVIMTVPITISGLGVRESVFAFFFTQVGVAAVDAVAISLLYYSFRVTVGLMGGLILLRHTVQDYLHTMLKKKVMT